MTDVPAYVLRLVSEDYHEIVMVSVNEPNACIDFIAEHPIALAGEFYVLETWINGEQTEMEPFYPRTS
jgi:quinol monooxygenase YgiN